MVPRICGLLPGRYSRKRHAVVRGRLGLLGVVLVLLGVLALAGAPAGVARAGDTVYVVQITGPIDPGLAPYLARALTEAERQGARAVVLEIDTPGGLLDSALQMRQALLDTPVPVIAFVDGAAFSAGALLALAADRSYMADGAVIGAATPVTAAGAPAGEKYVSALRATFRATAEANGRRGDIAEAMVDPAVVVEGLDDGQRLLTLTDDQALAVGYSQATVADVQEVLQREGLAGATVQRVGLRAAEHLVRTLTMPALAGLLFALGALLIVGEFLTAQFTGLGLAGAGLLALVFWGHLLAGLAGWEGLALAALGLGLLALEAFVIPGFGLAGVAGVAALLGGLFLTVTGEEVFTRQDLERGLSAVGVAFLGLLAGGAALLWSLPRLARARGLVLEATVGGLEPSAGDAPGRGPLPLPASLESDRRDSLLGATGEALSDLRPGGFALIDGQRVDVITRGDFVARGERVEVIADEGYRRVVRRLGPDQRAPAEI